LDLSRLRAEGFQVEVRGGYLLIHHVPYVTPSRTIAYGVLVSVLVRNGDTVLPPDNHVMYFVGQHPCNKDGTVISAIKHGSYTNQFLTDLTVHHSFSNRPPDGYPNYYDKVVRYVEIITAPAKSLDPAVTAQTFIDPPEQQEESVFQYPDTNSSKAKIAMISAKFAGLKIGIIGLGGTGAYVLDQVAKTPVAEIHLFDGDVFLQHNAFRSPGSAMYDEILRMQKKVDYYCQLYGAMHKHVLPHGFYLNEENLAALSGLSHVFICVDKNSIRKLLISHLLAKGIPFFDCGLGINAVDDTLLGTVRMSVGTPDKSDHLEKRVPTVDPDDELYGSNIQIADMNALTALLAVIKWKKMVGFYQDLIGYHNCTYTTNAAQLDTNDFTT
jgi:hypothetical protein